MVYGRHFVTFSRISVELMLKSGVFGEYVTNGIFSFAGW
jgi:hypothetical protein